VECTESRTMTRNIAVTSRNRELLRELSQIVTYRMDGSRDGYLDINLVDFVNKLYVNRDATDEEAVAAAIRDANQLLLVMGPCGSGKSTLIRSAIHCVNSGVGSDSRFDVVYDCKREGAVYNTLQGKRAARLKKITSHIKARLIEQSISESEEDEFLAALIRRNRAVMVDLRDDVAELRGDAKASVDECMQELKRNPKLTKKYRWLKRESTCAELIRAIKSVRGVTKLVLVIDNVDRIPFEHHGKILSFAVDEHAAGDGEFGIIAAFRNKSLMRYESSGAGGDVVRQVVIESGGGKHDHTPRAIERPNKDVLAKIQWARLEYAREKMAGRRGAPAFFALVDSITKALRKSVHDSNLIDLANQDIRESNNISMNFIRYVLDLVEEGKLSLVNGRVQLTDQACKSLFYGFLYRSECSSGDSPFDYAAIEELGAGSGGETLSRMFSLHALLYLGNNHHDRVTIGKLKRTLGPMFGLSSRRMGECLYRLYRVSSPSTRLVELGKSEKRVGREEMKDITRIYLTPRGRRFLGGAFVKFEFFRSSVYRGVGGNGPGGNLFASGPFDVMSLGKPLTRLRFVFGVLGSVYSRMRDRQGRRESDWAKFYSRHFGIAGDHLPIVVRRSHEGHFREVKGSDVQGISQAYRSIIRAYEAKVGTRQ